MDCVGEVRKNGQHTFVAPLPEYRDRLMEVSAFGRDILWPPPVPPLLHALVEVTVVQSTRGPGWIVRELRREIDEEEAQLFNVPTAPPGVDVVGRVKRLPQHTFVTPLPEFREQLRQVLDFSGDVLWPPPVPPLQQEVVEVTVVQNMRGPGWVVRELKREIDEEEARLFNVPTALPGMDIVGRIKRLTQHTFVTPLPECRERLRQVLDFCGDILWPPPVPPLQQELIEVTVVQNTRGPGWIVQKLKSEMIENDTVRPPALAQNEVEQEGLLAAQPVALPCMEGICQVKRRGVHTFVTPQPDFRDQLRQFYDFGGDIFWPPSAPAAPVPALQQRLVEVTLVPNSRGPGWMVGTLLRVIAEDENPSQRNSPEVSLEDVFADQAHLVREQGFGTFAEVKEYLTTRRQFVEFCRQLRIRERTIADQADAFGPDMETYSAATEPQKLELMLRYFLGAPFDELNMDWRDDYITVNFLLHDTYKSRVREIADRGLLVPQPANDNFYDGKLVSSLAPKVVFFQASGEGMDGTIYPREKPVEAKRRLLLPPRLLALHTEAYNMFFVSVKEPRNTSKEDKLQLHFLFIPPTHQAMPYCEANFMNVNKKLFQPFRYDAGAKRWKMFKDSGNKVAFGGRGVRVNIAVAQHIPWPYGAEVSFTPQFNPHDETPRVLLCPHKKNNYPNQWQGARYAYGPDAAKNFFLDTDRSQWHEEDVVDQELRHRLEWCLQRGGEVADGTQGAAP